MLLDASSTRIPPKPLKQSLINEVRVKRLNFKRKMSSMDVKNVIIGGFPDIQQVYPFKHLKTCKITCWRYLNLNLLERMFVPDVCIPKFKFPFRKLYIRHNTIHIEL